MPATKVFFDTYLLRTKTDAHGRFKAPHGLPFEAIRGIVVSIEDKEQIWHTVELSNSVDNRFFWNKEVVAGAIETPRCFDAPVEVIFFVQTKRLPG